MLKWIWKLQVFIQVFVGATKWFRGSNSFGVPEFWHSEELPCPLDQVVFPEIYPAVLPLPQEVLISGLVLPTYGSVLLSQDATIDLGSESHSQPCKNSDHRAFIKMPKINKWYDPQTWANIKTVFSGNNAVPELGQLPCNDEPVVITRTNGPLAFDLENIPFLRIGQLSLAGSSISKDYLQELINTDVGQMLFHNSEGVRVEYYRSETCGCLREFNNFLEPVCNNVISCERPNCLTPITPLGFCCPICGAALRIELPECNLLYSKKLKSEIESEITKNSNLQLDIHVDYFRSKMGNLSLQAVIVDHKDYSETSVNFVRQFLQKTNNTKLLKFKQDFFEVHYSGRPYKPNIVVRLILFILICLVSVCIFVVLLAHYAPNNSVVRHVPVWIRDPQRWRTALLRSPFVFTRFRDNIADRNIVEARIMSYHTENDEIREQEFDNPMFGEDGKLQNVSESTVNIDDKAQTFTQEALPTESVEEQELMEIKLDSSDGSDDEIESVK